MRGATLKLEELGITFIKFQSTRPMRGATVDVPPPTFILDISIHAPHAGRDLGQQQEHEQEQEFQSTRPMRGATHTKVR